MCIVYSSSQLRFIVGCIYVDNYDISVDDRGRDAIGLSRASITHAYRRRFFFSFLSVDDINIFNITRAHAAELHDDATAKRILHMLC